ncbi:uncharacterized protein LOC133779806 [Humulus lupulus]|uniref:uncharacterized protein LOC133779806 n=1 Tax=Humulus lupulus TaxID=3486 RepID=UPI002B40ABB9|nr:uncharacterized protein LOC133779806 [Humulus lupulus]
MTPIVALAVQQPEIENKWESLYERFRKQYPPTFKRGPDSLKVEKWMSLTTSILDFMRVVGNDGVAYATFMFRDDARIWWKVASQTRDVSTMSWNEFRDLLNQKYYSNVVRAAKVNEFTGLVQENMSVTEYALKFDRLAKFEPDLVPTDTTRFRREMPPFIEAGRGGGTSDQKRKTSDTSTTTGLDRRGRGIQGGRQGGNETWRSYPKCVRCMKCHLGKFRVKACYLCGVVGHLKKDCPSMKKEEPRKDVIAYWELVVSRRWIRSFPVVVDNMELSVDLIELGMDEFYMILGMDWLARIDNEELEVCMARHM